MTSSLKNIAKNKALPNKIKIPSLCSEFLLFAKGKFPSNARKFTFILPQANNHSPQAITIPRSG